MLGGMILTGAGVGLTLPTFMATGAASLPPHAMATGSAVINMLRQVGLAVGVAIFVAVLGSAVPGTDPTPVYQRGWAVIAAASLLAALVGVLTLRSPREAAQTPAGVVVAEHG